MIRIPLILSLLALLPASAIAQNTWYVPDDFPTIQNAIWGSWHGDTVIVRDGTYIENIRLDGARIVLKSENGFGTTFIEGLSGSGRPIITAWNGETEETRVEGFTINHGSASWGGGIFCLDSSPTFVDCLIDSNVGSEEGGGVYLEGSNSRFENCTFTNNEARSGGGIYCISSSPTFNGCLIDSNQCAYQGAGLYFYGGIINLTDCIVQNNLCISDGSNAQGGGIYSNYAMINLTNSELVNNSAIGHVSGITRNSYGAGLYCRNYSTVTFDTCIISGNASDAISTGQTTAYGGGLYISSSAVTLESCQMAGNSAVADSSARGGAIYIEGDRPLTINSCLIKNNEVGSLVLSEGGFLYSNSTSEVHIRDSEISGHIGPGGCFLLTAFIGSASLTNCLFFNNSGWVEYMGTQGALTIDSCTFANQLVGLESGTIKNSIFWGAGVMTTSQANFSFCCVEGGTPGLGNISSNPMFIAGPGGIFYLSQISAGQTQNSRCVDGGDPNSTPFGTTRTDEAPDGANLDMGYHYPVPPSPSLSVSNLVAGSQVLVEVNDATPNNFSHFAWSVNGGGPINTPFGQAMITPPYELRILQTDANGYASYTANIPPAAAGITVWCHGTDVGTQSMLNALMLVIQ